MGSVTDEDRKASDSPRALPSTGSSRTTLGISLVLAAAAALVGLLVAVGFHDSREVESLAVFLLKLVPFALALPAIALFPTWRSQPLNIVLLGASFAVFFCVLVPRMFWFAGAGNWDDFYLHMQIAVPFVILMVAFASRLAGGSTKYVLTLGSVLMLFMLSGVEDLTFWLVNGDAGPIPDVLTEASHMTVRVGRPLTRTEAYAFVALHLAAIVGVLTVAYSCRFAALRARIVGRLQKMGLDLTLPHHGGTG